MRKNIGVACRNGQKENTPCFVRAFVVCVITSYSIHYTKLYDVLLVAFGTSVPEALPAMKAVDEEFKAAFPGQPVVWA